MHNNRKTKKHNINTKTKLTMLITTLFIILDLWIIFSGKFPEDKQIEFLFFSLNGGYYH